jgi:hypothetical protein
MRDALLLEKNHSLSGNILKMESRLDSPVQYSLPIGESLLNMNSLIGETLKIEFDGVINCIATGVKIKKSYHSGYSFKAFQSLPECDRCIMSPEFCHFEEGTCRDPEWGKKFCFQNHIVYLALSSHLKVGITRETQVPTRWIDQGASFAMPLFKVKDRKTSGLIEVELKNSLSDKTNWRKMLSSTPEMIDFEEEKERIFFEYGEFLDDFDVEELCENAIEINYPVLEYPNKIKSLGFDKNPVVESKLVGIKGQYLILDSGVINLRKHQGYYLKITRL